MVDILIRFLADWLMIPIIIIGTYALIWKIPKGFRLDAYKRILMAGLTSFLLSKLIGHYYQPSAERPFELIGVDPGASYLTNAGFPSDHVMFIMAIMFAVWFETRQRKITYLMLFLICLVGLGRVLALVHAPIDILGGVIFAGVGCLWYIRPKNTK